MSTKKTPKQLCGRCGDPLSGVPAISRRDDRTHICQHCGMAEAMTDYAKTERKAHKRK